MIQRIQTIYLAVATALSGFLLNGSILTLVGSNGETYVLNWNGIFLIDNSISIPFEKTLPLTILLIIVPLLLFLAIFLYKRRKLQIRVTVLSTLLLLGVFILILYYIYYSGRSLEADYIFNIKVVFPPVGAILGYLAFRAILKDELLVKSYDRIR
ncbi:MAG: DUF4293 domain-containing protein [Bacteroidales bacterium]|nr:DUF4293 domain-containing protein [Bacteroidales bacterium]